MRSNMTCRRITTSLFFKHWLAKIDVIVGKPGAVELREYYRQGMILWLSLHKSERLWMGSAEQ